MARRTKPYTARGILRVPCFRCGGKSRYQWQVCADHNTWRALCPSCDVALNETVLHFMGDVECERKMVAYRERLGV